MPNASLSNASTKGLNIFLRGLLVFSEFLCLSFAYAVMQVHGLLFFIFSLLVTAGAVIAVFFIEKTLKDDYQIRHTYHNQQTFSLWRFVRLVFLGAGFWVIAVAIFIRGKTLVNM